MAVANEIPKIEAWIYAKITGSATITDLIGTRLHSYRAPEDEPKPFVLFNYQGPYNGGDLRGLGTVRVMTSTLWQIKLLTSGAPTDADITITNALDELFQEAAAETQNSYVFSARRIEPISYLEQVPGSAETIRHLGGLYLIQAHPLTIG